MYFLFSENKGTDQVCGVTVQLICAFVFAKAKGRFSHDMAQIHLICATGKRITE